ncbi:aequorin-2-like [Lingula anatina]|uniref:Aequorin-2-like n=1 Tax=Lingula anatina TaxID=7574 RepID=A0A1S3HVQ3_LINAN|nr:aequorin-2-like [Lingula anatina]|eukprot:XP_013390115.1 aequorin-2-like [Lingula anatina]
MFSSKLGIVLFIVIVPTVDFLDGVKIEQDNKETFTQYWVSKHKEHFDALDVNHDGNVTERELTVVPTNRAKHVLPSWRVKAVYGVLNMAYHTWWSNEYTDYKTSISFDDWIQSFGKDMVYTGDEVDEFALDFFHIVEVDCNEELTLKEYSKFLDIFRNTADIQVIFRAIDIDRNNVIDVKEFLYGIKGFTYDEAPDSAAYIFGSRDKES